MKEVDPIEELHQIRQKLYKEAGGTPQAFVRYIMERQKQYADRLVDLSKPGVVQGNPGRKSVRPNTKAPARKAGKRRKAVTP